jgi:RNA polymerase sigma-70 factor, ECF subfamily
MAPRMSAGYNAYPGAASARPISNESSEAAEIPSDAQRLAKAVGAARRGDAQGWNELFERFHSDVHAYALARLGEWAAAEDVTQETFVAAVTSIRHLRDDREPVVQAWFLHICRNKVVDHLRSAKRRDRGAAADPTAAQDPAQLAENRVLADEMRTAMLELTEDQRDILVRRFVLDQSLEQVAAATRRTVGAVKSLQHRALAALERILEARRRAA